MADQPAAELDTRFSHPDASEASWGDARERIEQAGVYWISTVRPNGAPHVTPLVGVWYEGAAWFCTGAAEQKGRNLARNPQLVLATGCNDHDEGLDIVIEGTAEQVTDDATLESVSAAYLGKYGEVWRFEARDGVFWQQGSDTPALVFRVVPSKVLAFTRGKHPSQTRWTARTAAAWEG